MNNAEQTKKESYSRTLIEKPDGGGLESIVMVATGFVEKVKIEDKDTAKGPMKRATIYLNSTIPANKVRYNFGEEFVTDKNRVRFNVSYIGPVAEAIERGNYGKGSMLELGMKNLRANEFTTNTGSIFRSLDAYGFDFPMCLKRVEPEENAGQPQTAYQQAPAQPQYAQQVPPQQFQQQPMQPQYQQAPQQYAPQPQYQQYAPVQGQPQQYAQQPQYQAQPGPGYVQNNGGYSMNCKAHSYERVADLFCNLPSGNE